MLLAKLIYKIANWYLTGYHKHRRGNKSFLKTIFGWRLFYFMIPYMAVMIPAGIIAHIFTPFIAICVLACAHTISFQRGLDRRWHEHVKKEFQEDVNPEQFTDWWEHLDPNHPHTIVATARPDNEDPS